MSCMVSTICCSVSISFHVQSGPVLYSRGGFTMSAFTCVESTARRGHATIIASAKRKFRCVKKQLRMEALWQEPSPDGLTRIKTGKLCPGCHRWVSSILRSSRGNEAHSKTKISRTPTPHTTCLSMGSEQKDGAG